MYPSALTRFQANNSDPPEKDMSVERAVGACVRALVDQVARPPQSSAVRPRAPYVSILRNPNVGCASLYEDGMNSI